MKYRYKLSQINPAESEIILLANNTKEAKGTVQSEIYVMREITYEEQVEGLLGQGRIEEAREVFLTRGPKSDNNYMQKYKMFHLDAGWQLLNTGQPKEILHWFKNTEVDPRELLLLFKDLTNSHVLIQEHLKAYPVNYLVDTYRKTHAIQSNNPNFNLDQKHFEAKEAVR